ncbi:hypothetical protein J6590_103325 [Homalodisca vitripennis]|nr:hypothetical protein J6590_103325 [Homalodisca vitripennis]
MSCNRCQDKSVPTLVRVTCWGCREGYTVHEKCFHMEEPEKRLYVEKKIWWCPPCLKARTARGYKLEDPPGKHRKFRIRKVPDPTDQLKASKVAKLPHGWSLHRLDLCGKIMVISSASSVVAVCHEPGLYRRLRTALMRVRPISTGTLLVDPAPLFHPYGDVERALSSGLGTTPPLLSDTEPSRLTFTPLVCWEWVRAMTAGCGGREASAKRKGTLKAILGLQNACEFLNCAERLVQVTRMDEATELKPCVVVYLRKSTTKLL